MSVLRSKRNIAQSEFENTFSDLYRFSASQTIKVAKRRYKWLCANIDTQMNLIYRNIMCMRDAYFSDKNIRQQHLEDKASECIALLNDLEQPLMMLWNVQKYETKTMVRWLEQIRREIALLNTVKEDKTNCDVSILDWQAINNAAFLKNMSELHRYTHGKVTCGRNVYDNTDGALLISLVNDAFYELILANKKCPETKTEYDKRKQHISNAITYLHNMNRPMLFYFNLMQYSERIMVEWSELLTSELKMLKALQRSDKERFKNLK